MRGAACWACGAQARPAADIGWAALQRCSSCGLLFEPQRRADEVRRLYDEAYFEHYPGGGSYDEDESLRRYEAAARLRFVRRFAARGDMLELGCATGHFLAASRDAGFAVTGVEPSAEAARRARERYGVDVRMGFAEDVDLPPEAFDVVCAWHVVEHIPDPAGVVRRLAGVLRPGGVLALEVPNVGSAQARRLGAGWPHLDPAHHVAHYGPESMRRLLERAGLEVVHVETFPGTGYYPRAGAPSGDARLLRGRGADPAGAAAPGPPDQARAAARRGQGREPVSAACWACGGNAAPARDLEPARYLRCSTCGLAFQPDRSPQDVHELYDARYFESFMDLEGGYGAQASERAHEARVRLRFVLAHARSGRMLEIGAAQGHFLEAAGLAGFDARGIEPADDAAAAGRLRAGLRIETGFIEDAALEPASYDLVCAWHVLEHLYEPAPTLRRIARSLVPGGRLLLELPNIDSALARRAGASWPHLHPEHHVAQYGPRALRALLERAGFAVDLIDTVSFFGYVIPSRRLRPRMLAAHALESARLRALPFAPHPTRHELLRAVARTHAQAHCRQ